MKKYKYILTFIILTLTVPNIVLGQTTDLNQKASCNNKRNGDACTYQEILGGGRTQTTSISKDGFCDRSNGGGDANSNPLTCKSGNDANGWEICTISGDACKDGNQLGVCGTRGPRGIPCDTTKKPPGTPGGRSPDGSSTGGGTCQDCGGNKCDPGQVCADVTLNGATRATCVTDKGNNNTCGGNACSAGQVCIDVTLNGATRATCASNKCIAGGGAGNGGGGTTPSENTTPTDATAPQTVGFINPIRFNSLTELIAGIINALLGILGAITVAVLVKSGFQYMISSNPGEVGQALDGIKNAIIGLMIIMGAFLITQYVISALAG